MLNSGQIAYQFTEGHKISDGLRNKLSAYSEEQLKLFTRYASMENQVIFALGQAHPDEAARSILVRNYMLYLVSALNQLSQADGRIINSPKELIDTIMSYLDSLPTERFADTINNIHAALSFRKELFLGANPYSYKTAATLLRTGNLTKDDSIQIAKCLYFAHDYLDFSAVLSLRKSILSKYASGWPLHADKLSPNPGTNLLSLLFSDKSLIVDLIGLYEVFASNPNNAKIDMTIWEDDALNFESFSWVCLFGYGRYLITAVIFVVQCGLTSSLDVYRICKTLLSIYNRFGFYIFTAFYKYINTFEEMSLPVTLLLEDMAMHTSIFHTHAHLDKARSLASAISRDSAVKDFTDVIEKICERAMKEWNSGCALNHMDMIRKFKGYKRYASYFKERGFESKLCKRMKLLCRENGIKAIAGEDVAARQGKKNSLPK